MRVFKSKEFARFTRKNGIEDSHLCRAVQELLAGSVHADLGGGVYKQRIARTGQGKSSGFRTILLMRREEVCIFVFGFAKKDLANVTFADVAVYRTIAKSLLVRDDLIQVAVEEQKLIEVRCDDKTVSK